MVAKFFLLAFGVLILPGAFAIDTTSSSSPSNRIPTTSQTARLEEQILCAFERNNLPQGPSRQRQRAQYLARHLSEIFSRLEPDWSVLELQHSLAQGVAETGNLRDLVERPSQYASSRSRYRGRGLIQTTHRENYAKLAGCAEAIQNSPIPRSISREQLASAPRLNNSDLVQNPDQVMSESTERGQFLNAASLVCYMVDTSERHRRMEQAMNCPTPPCVREVGVAVNRGPGALGRGRRPLGDQERIRAFCLMNSCFGNQGQCASGGR